jgi:hypothetical protein
VEAGRALATPAPLLGAGAFDVDAGGAAPSAAFSFPAFPALRSASSMARRSAACINSRTAASAIGPTFVGAL